MQITHNMLQNYLYNILKWFSKILHAAEIPTKFQSNWKTPILHLRGFVTSYDKRLMFPAP